jgi:plasmanylethanolamine desaturase
VTPRITRGSAGRYPRVATLLPAAGASMLAPPSCDGLPVEEAMLLVEILAVVLLADLVSGVVHWWEDSYAKLDGGPLKQVAIDNLRHHARPREFLTKGYWASSWDLWLLGALAVAASAALGLFSWHVVLFAVVVANANQVHKWTHRTREENGPVIGTLQRLHLLQTARHHSRHHQGSRDTHYCVLTNFLNPLLEEVQLWRRLERAVGKLTGATRRDEPAELAKLGLLPARANATRPSFAIRVPVVMPRLMPLRAAASAA